ncbi:hypothetical protein BU26DRAFT_296992 [Trematosphaeria pertusa]|uniref:Uncharacterized protein n=1 Tax=Trematosphaeria pertusa TaxID=390896 RepID=A0A6A6IIF3_9PLEO|nr:uncharacterized protein BU26DRAFT_296992 [Trematosphaeria pertusa]KAF2250191.1 hypothetical protein BU26DRAFT_296992 [Trematosphaeria pertusa]
MLAAEPLWFLAGVCLATCVAADAGDDIANNLPTDLAPLLALFGERVTTQFMSQSTGWADNIILAMAPLGVITAIVGAIRVGGPSWLKAIIGRARESRAVAEAELMSSTSNEVCELWNGGEVVRVMGAGPIREFIILLPDDWTSGPIIAQNVRVKELKDPEKEYLEDRGPNFRERITGHLHDCKNSSNTASGREEGSNTSPVILRNTVDHELNLTPAPNLTLNVQNQVRRVELYVVALIGIALQLGVVLYSGFATYHPALMLPKDGNPVADYAFPCTAAGTVLLVAGMLMCAYVIETSTTERTYRRVDGRKARIVWLQKSGTVNDQAFEPFAIFPSNAQLLVTTSRRAPGPKNFAAVTGTIVSICGFIVQFVGLRGMHWSAPVAQFGATVVMTTLRTLVRRHLAKPLEFRPLLSGHEMDWLAMTLGGDSAKAPWLKPLQTKGNTRCRPRRGDKDNGRKWDKYDRPWLDDNGDGWDWRIAAVEVPEDCKELEPRSGTSRSSPNPDRLIEQLQDQEDSTAHRVMLIRRGLGALADWHGPASAEAISLAQAIEVTMDALFGPKPLKGTFTWSIPAFKSLKGTDLEPINFRVELLENGKWKAYSDEIEAALSLWLYSVYELENPKDVKENKGQDTKDDAWLRAKGTPAKQSLRLLGSYSRALHQHLQWWMPNDAVRVSEVEASSNGTTIKAEIHRIVGFASKPALTQFYEIRPPPGPPSKDATDHQDGDGKTANVILAVESYKPLVTLFAQHMFSVFMWAAAKKMAGPIPGEADIRSAETDRASHDPAWQSFMLHNSQLSKMAQDIHSTGLGSLEDVYLCIIPPLSGEDKLGHWKDAAGAYLWLFLTATIFPEKSGIFTKATAVLVEHLGEVNRTIELREAQQYEERDIEDLRGVKSKLEGYMRNRIVRGTATLCKQPSLLGMMTEVPLTHATPRSCIGLLDPIK